MGDYTPNIDAVQRRIRQRKAALIPDEHDPELRQAYETLLRQYRQLGSDTLTAADVQYLLEAPQYIDDTRDDAVIQVLEEYVGDTLDAPPVRGGVSWNDLATAGERTLQQYDENVEDAYRDVIRIGLARRRDNQS